MSQPAFPSPYTLCTLLCTAFFSFAAHASSLRPGKQERNDYCFQLAFFDRYPLIILFLFLFSFFLPDSTNKQPFV